MGRKLSEKSWAIRRNPKLLCEACKKEPAWAFGWDHNDQCRLVGDCTNTKGLYEISFHNFLTYDTPQDWIDHVSRKTWCNQQDWLNAIERSGLLNL